MANLVGWGQAGLQFSTSLVDALTKAYQSREQRKYEEETANKKAKQDLIQSLATKGQFYNEVAGTTPALTKQEGTGGMPLPTLEKKYLSPLNPNFNTEVSKEGIKYAPYSQELNTYPQFQYNYDPNTGTYALEQIGSIKSKSKPQIAPGRLTTEEQISKAKEIATAQAQGRIAGEKPLPTRIGEAQAFAQVETEKKAATDRAVRLEKLKGMKPLIDFVKTKINEIPSGEGLMGRAQGIGQSIEAYLQTNPQAAAYQSTIDGLRSQVARGLGEVGNLSEYEQKYAIDLMPKLTDNTETRKLKIKNFEDYINTKIESEKQNTLLNQNNQSIPQGNPSIISEEDIQATMQAHPELSREDILKILGQ